MSLYLLIIFCFCGTSTMASLMESRLMRRIASSTLFVSEPDPRWFGNPANDSSDNPKWSNKNWLKSRFHFSFAEYSDPARKNFGVLRVMNDDLVQPKRGFGEHPHRDAEICTYIVNGHLTHKDSMSNAETLDRGAIQFMSSGQGVTHSEHNLSEDPLRFIQMWMTPRRRNLTPAYGSFAGDAAGRANRFSHLVSDVDQPSVSTPVKINQDVNMFVTEMDPGLTLPFNIGKGRMAYLLCIEGEVSLSDASSVSVAVDGTAATTATHSSTVEGGLMKLEQHDAAHLYEGAQISFVNPSSTRKNHLLVVEMAKSTV